MPRWSYSYIINCNTLRTQLKRKVLLRLTQDVVYNLETNLRIAPWKGQCVSRACFIEPEKSKGVYAAFRLMT
ncbi:hypothetical protein SADUNF_Sadunf11G0025200 [Salix dunnii]|uniref:Uncharacterized protein n=1 Tax=Salix dunnii TaxID=1413687 RepID=A0A835JM65_9ROSI|nr:hypothetical protein SADUNF_Sadunf11G0025200 [Salix dunnii]